MINIIIYVFSKAENYGVLYNTHNIWIILYQPNVNISRYEYFQNLR